MRKCAVLAASLALLSTGCHFKPKDLLNPLDASKGAMIAVAISPASASIPIYGTQQFTTTVTDASDAQVTWSLGGAPCSGGQNCGSISAKGLYVAPGVIPNPNPITVTASAQSDGPTPATAQVTITPAVEAEEILRGSYSFLVTGSDSVGTLSLAGKFVADGAGQLQRGELSFCRGEAPCTEQAFAGRYATSAKNQGSFWVDILSEAKFCFVFTGSGIVKLQLEGSKGLHATGIMEFAKDASGE